METLGPEIQGPRYRPWAQHPPWPICYTLWKGRHMSRRQEEHLPLLRSHRRRNLSFLMLTRNVNHAERTEELRPHLFKICDAAILYAAKKGSYIVPS